MKGGFMSHERFRDLVSLSVYDEVNKEERLDLEQHMKGCESCRRELENLKKLHVVLGSRSLVGVSEEMLQEARMQLRTALRVERTRPSFRQRVSERLPFWVTRYPAAWSSVFALVIGLLIGRATFSPSAPVVPGLSGTSIRNAAYNLAENDFEHGGVEITNVKFSDADASDGQVEFTFNAVAPMHYRGSINDPKVQQVLTQAIVNEENPGTRLAAVNTLEKYQPRDPDPEIKQTLIKAAKKDACPAVRQQALSVLQKFPFDEDIKDTFLYVLIQDQNPGLRIEAIKGLEGKNRVDQEVLEVLKKKATTDDNNYIRLRATNVLMEVKQ